MNPLWYRFKPEIAEFALELSEVPKAAQVEFDVVMAEAHALLRQFAKAVAVRDSFGGLIDSPPKKSANAFAFCFWSSLFVLPPPPPQQKNTGDDVPQCLSQFLLEAEKKVNALGTLTKECRDVFKQVFFPPCFPAWKRKRVFGSHLMTREAD